MHAQRAFPRPLLLAVTIAVIVMSALAVVRWQLWTYGSDTGTFAQVIWNVPRGFTDQLERGGTHFRTHWSPILAVLWPLVALTKSPLSLQFAQVLLIVASALPLYAIVERYAGSAWATRCAVLLLIYPPLLANAFSEFHELAFYPVLALTMVWAADRARWVVFLLVCVALVTIREDACVDLAIIGIVFAAIGIHGMRAAPDGLLFGRPAAPKTLVAAGITLSALAVAALFYYTRLLAHIGPWSPSHFYRYPFANGPVQTVASIFTHPLQLIEAIATRGRLTYVLEAFIPLALLPCLTAWTLLALPAFAGILLSSEESVWRMGMHYVLLWAPWMMLAAAWAIVRLCERGSQRAALWWWRAAVTLCIVFLIAFNPMHPAHYLRRAPYQHSADAVRAFACVPPDARIATHDEWFAHQALAFTKITVLPDDLARYRGYVVYATDWRNAHFLRIKAQLDREIAQGTLRIVCRFGAVRTLRTI